MPAIFLINDYFLLTNILTDIFLETRTFSIFWLKKNTFVYLFDFNLD